LFLDRHLHEPARVRTAMLRMLAAATCVELGLYAYGYTQGWLLSISLVSNVWGGLDALLRYPVAHRVDSFFCIKQVALLLAKATAYTFGMVIMTQFLIVFLAILLLDICALSVLYIMSLPFDSTEKLSRHDDCNVDLAVRVWQMVACSSERRQCTASCKGWMRRGLLAASESSSLARMVICTARSDHRQGLHIRRVRRDV